MRTGKPWPNSNSRSLQSSPPRLIRSSLFPVLKKSKATLGQLVIRETVGKASKEPKKAMLSKSLRLKNPRNPRKSKSLIDQVLVNSQLWIRLRLRIQTI